MAITVGTAVGSALLAGGATFATASAIVTALPTILLAGASIATSAILAERQRSQFQNAVSGLNDYRGLQQDQPDAAPDHLMCLGYATLSGSRFFMRGGEENRPYFWIGRLLAAHECEGLDAVFINNQKILIDPITGIATSAPFYDGVTPFIEVSFRNGHIDQAIDPIIARDFPSVPATFRQRGHCTIVIKAHYGTGASVSDQDDKHKALYGDGAFNPIIRLKGAKVYDPRDPTQLADDASTWKWTRNGVLNTLHGLCWRYPHMRSQIDWTRTKDEADICDIFQPTKAGEMLKQFTLDGAISSADDAVDMITGMLTSCGGQLLRSSGKIYVLPAQTKKPVGTLSLANQRGAIQYYRDKQQSETVNEVRPEFMSPERNYQIVPGPVIRRQADVDEDGLERPVTTRLPFTERHERAQRLSKRIYEEGRIAETLATDADVTALKWQAGEVITVDFGGMFTGADGDWEILSKEFELTRNNYHLQLRRYKPTIGDYDPAVDEQTFVVEEIE